MSDEKQFGPGQEATVVKDAAQQRAEYVAALKVEREGYVRAGKTDRVKQVDAALARFDAAPKARTSGKRETAEG